jgi:putative peptidoglycan lipid II flippase
MGYFGTAIWDCFVVPFQIPNLFRRLFGEGALTAALIPVYTEKRLQDPQAARQLARSVLTLLVLILTGLTLAGLAFILLCTQWLSLETKTLLTFRLAAIMLPYMILICSVATLSGLLNIHHRFGVPAAVPILFNLSIILAVIFLSRSLGADLWQQIPIVAFAVLVAGVLQILLLLPSLHRAGISICPRFNFKEDSLKKIMRLMAPMLIGLSVVQFNVVMNSIIAYFLRATPESGETFIFLGQHLHYPVSEGAVSHLYLAARLYQFPLGVFAISLATAIFPHLSRYVAQNEIGELSKTLAQGIRSSIFIAIPATIGLILVAKPLVQVSLQWSDRITEQDTDLTAYTLCFYAIGLVAYSIQPLIVRTFYAFQDSVTPVKVAVAMVVLNLILNLILIWPLGTAGLALATAIGAIIQLIVLSLILVRRYKLTLRPGLLSSTAKTIVATVAMIVTTQLALNLISASGPLPRVIIIVVIAAVTFVLISLLLKNSEAMILLRKK